MPKQRAPESEGILTADGFDLLTIDFADCTDRKMRVEQQGRVLATDYSDYTDGKGCEMGAGERGVFSFPHFCFLLSLFLL